MPLLALPNMSEDQLKAFIASISSNPSLQEKLREPNADPVALAKELGLNLGANDVSQLMKLMSASGSTLNDEELEALSGGAQNSWCGWAADCCTALM
jgi:predicted ribosomally synthesized peptide with nif11-like leader